MDSDSAISLISHPDLNETVREFIFIGSDAVYQQHSSNFEGSITVQFPWKHEHIINQLIWNMTPLNSKHNPWFMKKWQQHFNCSYDLSFVNDGVTDCNTIEHLTLPRLDKELLSTTIDSVNAVVYALHKLIQEHCPEASVDKSILKTCVHGGLLLAYLKKTSFQGSSWHVSFDDLGNANGTYRFEQYQQPNSPINQFKSIGTWERSSGNLQINSLNMNWSSFRIQPGVQFNKQGVPDSVCSYPCGPRRFKQQRDLPCCWDCLECRNNEIFDETADDCLPCLEFYWPDESTATHCIKINPRYAMF